MRDRAGVRTRYAGVEFRSRREAAVARLLDVIGWRWEYEPQVIGDYLPDFISGDLVIEVKPTPLPIRELERIPPRLEVWVFAVNLSRSGETVDIFPWRDGFVTNRPGMFLTCTRCGEVSIGAEIEICGWTCYFCKCKRALKNGLDADEQHRLGRRRRPEIAGWEWWEPPTA